EWLDKKGDDKAIRDMKSFASTPQKDDVHVVNELHMWKDHQVLVHLTTRDVLHSFNLPQLRVKQDALPGKSIPVWFKPIKANLDSDNKALRDSENKPDPKFQWEIPCAVLCGWGHGRMIGR